MITYAMKSEPGDRQYNEDSVRACQKKGSWVFALGDGLGGCGHGELASRTAVDSVMSTFRLRTVDGGFLDEAMEQAQEAVLMQQRANSAARRMRTTLVVLAIRNGCARWAHIGDSRLYLFRRGKLAAQTLDHSVPQRLADMGEITREEIRHHPDRSVLLRSVGASWEIKRYEIAPEVEIKKGDAFLLCSDGFWEYITEEFMCKKLEGARSAEEWLLQMEELVKKNGRDHHMDNFSAICVMVD